MTGVRVTLYTSVKELEAVSKQGTVEVRATVEKTDHTPIQISAALEACTFIDYEVRVSVMAAKVEAEKVSAMMGAAMAAELEKVFESLEG